MRKLLLAALLLPGLAWAQSPFDGTWAISLDSAKFPDRAEELVLKDGQFSCSTCVPRIDVRADGSDQKVTGAPYFDTMAVTVVDPRSIRMTGKKDGKAVFEQTTSVSGDGRTLTQEFTSYPPEGPPVKGTLSSTRTAKGPDGAHAISGSWRATKMAELSEHGRIFTLKSAPDGLSMTSKIGESYDAKFDGSDYPIKGDAAGTTVSLERVDERTIREHMKRQGKVVSTTLMRVAADGKTMDLTIEDKERGATITLVAHKR
jgi:hypothetical protein